MPLELAIPLAIASALGLAYAVLHDANTRRAARRLVQQGASTSRAQVQQRPARDTNTVLDQPWWESA